MDFTNKPVNRPTETDDEGQHNISEVPGLQPTPTAAPSSPTNGAFRQKQSKSRSILNIVVWLLLLGTIAYAAWATLQWQAASDDLQAKETEVSDLKSANFQLNTDNKPADKKIDKAAEATVPKSDDEKIQAAVTSYLATFKAAPASDSKVTVTKKEGDFAIAKATGGAFYLKKTKSADWVVIYDGQNVPPQEVVDKFGIPATLR